MATFQASGNTAALFDCHRGLSIRCVLMNEEVEICGYGLGAN